VPRDGVPHADGLPDGVPRDGGSNRERWPAAVWFAVVVKRGSGGNVSEPAREPASHGACGGIGAGASGQTPVVTGNRAPGRTVS
jgi:hypothetical protein